MLAQILSIGLNNCLQCGSFASRSSLLCARCEANLFADALEPFYFSSEVRRVPCLSLFHWSRDRNRILNRLMLSLKGGFQQKAWAYYADRFLEEWFLHEKIANSAVIVPCPSHNGEPDHAFLFADSLSKKTGIPLISCLEHVSAKEQKRLSLHERQRQAGSKFRLKEKVGEKFSYVYFVDDIITSGTTVQAAQSLLKTIGHVKAISLTIRR